MNRKIDWSETVWWSAMTAVAVLAVVFAFWVHVPGGKASAGDREEFISGAEAARDVINECERGSDACDAVLVRMNGELQGQGLGVMEDGSVFVIKG